MTRAETTRKQEGRQQVAEDVHNATHRLMGGHKLSKKQNSVRSIARTSSALAEFCTVRRWHGFEFARARTYLDESRGILTPLYPLSLQAGCETTGLLHERRTYRVVDVDMSRQHQSSYALAATRLMPCPRRRAPCPASRILQPLPPYIHTGRPRASVSFRLSHGRLLVGDSCHQ